jgi:NADPH:quinone reductase
MRLAAVCTELSGEGAIELQNLETAPLEPAAVRVAVHAASVNFPDVLMIRGLYQARLEPPFVPGSECVGVITEVGDDVSGLAVGDRVLTVCGGAFTTEAVATPAVHQVHRIPDEMPFVEAACFNMTYGTAINGLVRRGGLRDGESVVVLGASGGCGSAAIKISKAVGAQVIAVAVGEEKCELARRLGADVVVDHHAVASLSEAVKQQTGGRGADVVFHGWGIRCPRTLAQPGLERPLPGDRLCLGRHPQGQSQPAHPQVHLHRRRCLRPLRHHRPAGEYGGLRPALRLVSTGQGDPLHRAPLLAG